jgi:hypothetical protein
MIHRSFVSCILALAAVFLASTSNAFTTAQPKTCGKPATTTTTESSSKLFSSPPTGDQGTKPDLVDSTLFKAAIKRINDEIEAQYQTQKIAEGTATEEPSEEEKQWLEEQAQGKIDEETYIYLVGKLDVTLPIDTQPELDLTESVGPLVLVTNVWGRTAEATGMQEFDTLTKVSVDDPNQPFAAKTKCTTLEETAGALTAAAQHAISLGKTEIQLEVQRLIKGYYAPEDRV